MKLYATTTSERATKGQGGNQFLNIDVFSGGATNNVKILSLHIANTIDKFPNASISIEGKAEILEAIEKKAKKQKGEKCTAKHWSKNCKGCEFCKRTLEQD